MLHHFGENILFISSGFPIREREPIQKSFSFLGGYLNAFFISEFMLWVKNSSCEYGPACNFNPVFKLIVPLINLGPILLVVRRKMDFKNISPEVEQDRMDFILITRIRTDLDDLHHCTMFNLCPMPDLVIDEGILNHFTVAMLGLIPF